MSSPPNPGISVIVPTYNRADWLAATVQAALAQTVPPLEVIVVDDGSSDGTEAVAGRIPGPVRYLRQTNAGVAAARNAGAAAARGELLAFLDCEDLWEPQKLEVQAAVLRAHPEVGWSITGCTVVDLQDRPLPGVQGWLRVFPPFQGTGRSPDEFFGEDLAGSVMTVADRVWHLFVGDAFRLLCFGNFGLPSSAVVRRSVFEASGGFDPAWRLAEETEFFHRLAAEVPVGIVLEPLVRYRVGQAGALTSPANTRALVSNALASLDRARARRGRLLPAEDAAFLAGRRRLLDRLAYSALADGEMATARQALAVMRSEYGVSPRAAMLTMLSVMPPLALRLLHRLKRVAS